MSQDLFVFRCPSSFCGCFHSDLWGINSLGNARASRRSTPLPYTPPLLTASSCSPPPLSASSPPRLLASPVARSFAANTRPTARVLAAHAGRSKCWAATMLGLAPRFVVGCYAHSVISSTPVVVISPQRHPCLQNCSESVAGACDSQYRHLSVQTPLSPPLQTPLPSPSRSYPKHTLPVPPGKKELRKNKRKERAKKIRKNKKDKK